MVHASLSLPTDMLITYTRAGGVLNGYRFISLCPIVLMILSSMISWFIRLSRIRNYVLLHRKEEVRDVYRILISGEKCFNEYRMSKFFQTALRVMGVMAMVVMRRQTNVRVSLWTN